MISRRWRVFALLLCLAPLAAQTAEIQPFARGSMKQIVAAYQNRPFILGLWSTSCAHCREDLAMLGELSAKYPGLDLVLIATDTPEEREAVADVLKQNSLERAQAWVFADTFAERLRFEIDRKWRGELPRTYFFEADGSSRAVTGVLDRRQLERWAETHTGTPSP